MDTINSQLKVEVGFIAATRETMFLSRVGFLLMWVYRWLWGLRRPIRFRHTFICVDGSCFDLTTGGITWWEKSMMYEDIYANTVFLPVHHLSYDPADIARVHDYADLRIRHADIVRALLRQEVKGMFCASFVGRLLGLDVPLDIEPDSLYDVLSVMD
ncbi:hypothetical protein [Arthronema virus TR020]|uniref:Uncharacterized protein n=1 Tax=Arthronema virus TR020 TaxID=2736280 RepID=A0A7G3WH28_9CAUD|nr:hypothetical protein [Arthronema virus TR020]